MEQLHGFSREEYVEAVALVQPRPKAEEVVTGLFAAARAEGADEIALDVGILVSLTFVSASCASRARERLAHVTERSGASAARLTERMAALLGRQPYL